MCSTKSGAPCNRQNIYPDITRVSRRFIITASIRVFLCVLFAALWPTLRVNAQESVGYVLEIEGRWYLDGHSHPLAKQDVVPVGGVIRIQAPSRDDFIRIGLNGGGSLSMRCRSDGACSKPLVLPGVTQRPSSMLQSIMALLRGNRGNYVVVIRRSPCGQPSEAVVQAENGQVNLAPVFKGMAKNQYHVQLRRVPPGSNPISDLSGEPTIIDWDPAGDSAMPPFKLEEGIYEMALIGCTAAEPEAPIATAWLLVCSHERYAQTASLFREASSFTQTWEDDVNQETVRSFLRASLEYLALQPIKAEK
jgi:hypothetical protein